MRNYIAIAAVYHPTWYPARTMKTFEACQCALLAVFPSSLEGRIEYEKLENNIDFRSLLIKPLQISFLSQLARLHQIQSKRIPTYTLYSGLCILLKCIMNVRIVFVIILFVIYFHSRRSTSCEHLNRFLKHTFTNLTFLRRRLSYSWPFHSFLKHNRDLWDLLASQAI
ncbi:hypothetical protein DFS33DRAFT_1288371 [Desarmillaria ectypa]|nr:hypothetical protein DFS33DRAFT_1288371 [Desarmillaria ectypa]